MSRAAQSAPPEATPVDLVLGLLSAASRVLCMRGLLEVGRLTPYALAQQLTALLVRGNAVPDVARERILAEKDVETLEWWLELVIVAASLAEVLDEPS